MGASRGAIGSTDRAFGSPGSKACGSADVSAFAGLSTCGSAARAAVGACFTAGCNHKYQQREERVLHTGYVAASILAHKLF